MKLPRKSSPKHLAVWGAILISLIALAYGLGWLSLICPPCDFTTDHGPVPFSAWLSFFIMLLVCTGFLTTGWWAMIASERSSTMPKLPSWLAALVIGAALLRLALGILWMITLPGFGHATAPEISGYVMADAHERDQTAWKLAVSQKPLFQAFQGSFRKADQYGGLLFVSALVYRYTGAATHQPLLMIVGTAAFSALAILFTWGFARRTWDDGIAKWAAWGMAIYPEAALLGSSQMREAFIISLAAAAFYGLARLRRDHSWSSLAWILVGVLLTLPFSPPITIVLILALIILAFSVKNEIFHTDHRAAKSTHKTPAWAWVIITGVVLIALVGLWLALRQFAPAGMNNPIEVISYWLRKSTDLQAHFSKAASGWVQKIFKTTPDWIHIPLLTGYGILRPFLPAALVVSSEAPIWSWITLWRAIGWTLLLILLASALLRAWLHKDTDRFTRALTIVVWFVILIASLRGGGDQDDNPRYRAAFASLQVALAAWTWVDQRRSADPVFRRAIVGIGFILAWFVPWYLRREFQLPWPVVDPFKVLGLGLASAILFAIWDWARSLTVPATKNHEKEKDSH